MTLKENPFESIVGKGENAVNQHFLRFPQCFLIYQKKKKKIAPFDSCWNCHLHNHAFNFEKVKILSSGK